MNSLKLAIQAYAKHAMLPVATVEQLISEGDVRVCTTVAKLRIRFEG